MYITNLGCFLHNKARFWLTVCRKYRNPENTHIHNYFFQKHSMAEGLTFKNCRDCESNTWSSVLPPLKICQDKLAKLFSVVWGFFNKSKNGVGTGLAPSAHIFFMLSWTQVQSVQQNQLPLNTSCEETGIRKDYSTMSIISVFFCFQK